MLLSEAEIGDEVIAHLASGDKTFIVVGKCADFWLDNDLIGDVFMDRETRPHSATFSGTWTSMKFFPCAVCSPGKPKAVTGPKACTCPTLSLMSAGCTCGAFVKPPVSTP